MAYNPLDKINVVKKIREKSFVEQHLVIAAPNKWYQMTPAEVFTHNIGPGVYNDLVRQFVSRTGLGFTLGIAALDQHHNAVESIGRQAVNITGGRIGLGIGGAIGSKTGTMIAHTIGKKLLKESAGILTNPLRLTGLVTGGVIGTFLGSMAAEGALETGKRMVEHGSHFLAPDLGYGYKETRGAVTARQRSLLAMKTSRFNTRSILGNEAYRLATGF